MKKGRVFKKLKKVLIAITCAIVVVFSMPIKSKATVAEDAVDLLLKIPDGLMYLGNVFLSGRASSESSEKINLKGIHWGNEDEGHIYNFYITPYDIFSNGRIRTEKDATGRVYQYKVLPLFNANFFKDTSDRHIINENMKGVEAEDGTIAKVVVTSGSTATNGYVTTTYIDPNDSADILRPAISNVYKFLRNFAIVVMMLVLMYIGIRIIISSATTEQSKYKQMLIDWVVGLCLLFVMHYIMSFVMNVTDIIIDMLASDETNSYYIGFDELGAAEGAWNGFGEEWYEFFDNYHDANFINSHLALRAQNDAGQLIQPKLKKAAGWTEYSLKRTLWFFQKAGYIFTNPGTAAWTIKDAIDESKVENLEVSDYFKYSYYWEDWEDKLEETDDSLGYSSSGINYLNGKDEKKSGIFHRTYDDNGNGLVIATAKDRLIHLGNAHSDWGKNGDVTLNAIITEDDIENGIITDYRHICIYRGNIMEYIRTISSFGRKYVHIYDDNSSTGFTSENDSFMYSFGNAILYLALVIETIMFVWIYFKRLLQLAFLTMIAPLVAFMYPLDKVGDGKAQAFNTWFKDYLFTALLQPFHLLLYTVFITAAVDLTQKNIIYALAVYAFMIPAEKYFKKILGFEKSSTASSSGLAGAAGAMLGMRGFDRLAGLGPHGKGGKGGSGHGRTRFKIPRRGTGSSGGGAPTSGGAPLSGGGAGGTGTAGSRAAGRRGAFGRAASAFGNAARSARGGSPNAGGTDPSQAGKGLLPNGRRAISGALTRGLTGGKHSSFNGMKASEIRKAIAAPMAGALGKGALKTAGRALGVAAIGGAGAIVGGATALATGDASNFFKVAGGAVATGWNRGGQLGDAAAGGIGGLIQDAKAYRASTDQEYADKILAEEGIKAFNDNGIILDSTQQAVTRAVSPYKDLNGDEDKLKPYTRAFDQIRADNTQELLDKNGWSEDQLKQRQEELQGIQYRSDDDIDADATLSDTEKAAAKQDQQDKLEIDRALNPWKYEDLTQQAVNEVGDAKGWGKLNEEKRQQDFINAEIRSQMEKNHPDVKVPEKPAEQPEITQSDIDTHASSMDVAKATEMAQKEKQAKIDDIQNRIEQLDETYDTRIAGAKNAGDKDRAKKLEDKRKEQREKLEQQKAQEEARALDIEAKKKEMAKAELEAKRQARSDKEKAKYEKALEEYNNLFESYRLGAESKLRRAIGIQEKL